ncbi:glycerol-3-phosphate dehydrogenase/oxidase [Reinekea sp.]|jgi:glycerol-3-phosphate dehydrogenase|uniref:glycerol-3-phosphate dehydrogenase/oxidase n=1 Tax=Reinekea sp. TaxID=1970455 RepID=UPI0039895F9F
MNTEHLASIEMNEKFDVVVIGGGINGIGVYRELALQGLSVLLVDKNDFCSGASSAPSRMIHGGLRYLENAEFDLVRESLAERNNLLKNAPHLVKPLRTMVPVNEHFAGLMTAGLRFFGLSQSTSDRGSVIVKIGLMFYDIFTRKDQVLPKHTFYGKKATKKLFPSMRESVKCTAQYFDAWISSPERLALELLKEGSETQSAQRAINHCEVTLENSSEIKLKSQLDGSSRTISSEIVINATGAWIDEVNQDLGFHSEFITGTKGSHIVVDHQELHDELAGSMLYYENSENRVCILFPYMGKVLIGSTDIPVKDLSNVFCTDEEVDYILESLKTVLPGITIDKSQIVYKFSGVRPLGSASKETAGQIPRSHKLQVSSVKNHSVISMVGGKWTTFRAFAEQATDQTLALLNKQRVCSTQNKTIGGGVGYPENEQVKSKLLKNYRERYAVTEQQADILFDRYGMEMAKVLEFSDTNELTPLSGVDGYFIQEMQYLVNVEFARELEDLVMRRTNIAIEGQLHNVALVELALIMQTQLGWSDNHTIAQLKKCATQLSTFNGCALEVDKILESYKKFIKPGESKCS